MERQAWAVPYLTIDPGDIGRSYEAVIRLNSQSGKGGVAYLMKTGYHLDLPRRLQIEFSQAVQRRTDSEGGEVSAEDLWKIFEDEYLPAADNAWGRFMLNGLSQSSHLNEDVRLTVELLDSGTVHELSGTGNGPIAAFVSILNSYLEGAQVRVLDYSEHALKVRRWRRQGRRLSRMRGWRSCLLGSRDRSQHVCLVAEPSPLARGIFTSLPDLIRRAIALLLIQLIRLKAVVSAVNRGLRC